MNTTEFEAALTGGYGCYFIHPSLFVPGSNETADYVTAEELLQVFANDKDKLSRCVRKRSEQSNAMTYYIRNQWGNGYFRAVVPTGTGAGGIIDMVAVHFKFKQICDTIAVRLGLA